MMGIRPNRDGLIPPVTPDNPETRYSDWINDLEDSGEIVGGVWKETDAKATSASNGVSDLAGRVAALETGEVDHKHVSADITDARHYVGANLLLKMDGDGHFHVADPTEETHPAHKRYVDTEVKAIKDIAVPWNLSEGIVRRDANSLFHVAEPTAISHPTSKQYVDKANLDRLFVVRAASTGYNPATVIAGLPTGQVYLDIRDMSINVKD